MKPAPLSTSIGIVVCLALANPAKAERAPSGEIVAYEIPGFVTLDRTGEGSYAELAAGTSFFEGDDPDFNTRVDLYGQYVTPSRAGGYAALPVSFLYNDDESETAVGNLELGALYNLRASPRTAIALRAGVMLPTADDDPGGILLNYLTAYSRFTDVASTRVDRTFLRLAASPTHRAGGFFLRADLGLDLVVDEPEGADSDPTLRVNLGAGFSNGAVAVMGELVSVGTTRESDPGDERFDHAVAVAVRGGMGSGIQGFAAVLFPLDEASSPLAVDFAVIAGTRVPFEQ